MRIWWIQSLNSVLKWFSLSSFTSFRSNKLQSVIHDQPKLNLVNFSCFLLKVKIYFEQKNQKWWDLFRILYKDSSLETFRSYSPPPHLQSPTSIIFLWIFLWAPQALKVAPPGLFFRNSSHLVFDFSFLRYKSVWPEIWFVAYSFAYLLSGIFILIFRFFYKGKSPFLGLQILKSANTLKGVFGSRLFTELHCVWVWVFGSVRSH